jgi:hypothetical protein
MADETPLSVNLKQLAENCFAAGFNKLAVKMCQLTAQAEKLEAAKSERDTAAHEAKWKERLRWAGYCDSMVKLIDLGVAAPGGARAAFTSMAKSLREPDPTEPSTPATQEAKAHDESP